MERNVPTPLAIDTFDADCDLTLRPRRLAAQMLDRADDAIGCGDMPRVKKLIWEAQARWGGHTDVYIGISTLRVYERSLLALTDAPAPAPDVTCAVIGCGYLGARVAAELAICGFTVRVHDKGLQQAAVEPVCAAIREADQNELLGGSANAAKNAMARVTACTSVGDAVQGCRLLCECVIEDPSVKADILNEAAKVCPGDCVFTTSSMNLPLAEIQKLVSPAWRNRVIGLRFLAPVLSMPLVEVTYEPGIEQRSEVKEVCDMMNSIGKAVCEGARDPESKTPYVEEGFETVTDLVAAGIGGAAFEPFGFKVRAQQALVEHVQSLKPEAVY